MICKGLLSESLQWVVMRSYLVLFNLTRLMPLSWVEGLALHFMLTQLNMRTSLLQVDGR